jgi:alpha-mannosidase
LDPKTGWIVSLKDKAAVRELLRSPAFLQAVVDEPENMSAWELGLKNEAGKIGEAGSEISVIESGPVRAVLRVRSPFRSSAFSQDIILTAKVPRIDFRVEIDWQERNLMIKSAFPFDMKSGQAEFEIPWVDLAAADGVVPAPLGGRCDDSGVRRQPAQRGQCGFDVRDNTCACPSSMGRRIPILKDRGQTAVLRPRSPQGAGKTLHLAPGLRVQQSLIARIVWPMPPPASRSFFTVRPGNIVLTALKKEMGYAQTGLILRFCELTGKATEAAVELPWNVDAWETDLIERPGAKLAADGKTLKFALGPFEIKTLRIVPKR